MLTRKSLRDNFYPIFSGWNFYFEIPYHKLAELERKIERHDEDIKAIFDAIRQLMSPPIKPKPQIGFHP